MKNILIRIGIGIGIVSVWGLFLCLPYFLLHFDPCLLRGNNITFNELNMAYVAATALFTALAFGVTWLTLRSQRKDLVRKTTLDVFTNVFNDIQTELDFLKSKDYVFSNHFKNGLNFLEEQKGKGNVLIDDFKKLKMDDQSEEQKEIQCTPKKKRTNRKKFDELILYFCNKMEYIGIIVKNKYIDETILDYFGKTIIQSHEKLKPLLEAERTLKNDNTIFFHFSFLNDLAKEREPIFKAECQKYLDINK